MNVLAIDPGKNTGGALWPAGQEPIAFTLLEPKAVQIYTIVRWAMVICGARPLLVTEDQYLARGAKANPQSTLEIARRAEQWITIADLLGLDHEQPTASTWRSPLIDGIEGRDMKARTREAIARKWPTLLLGMAGLGGVRDRRVATADKKAFPQDPIDALGMAYWAVVHR